MILVFIRVENEPVTFVIGSLSSVMEGFWQ